MAQDYTNMSVQDKLRLADERLEKLKGTDKYEAFKERVDAMHAKYGSVPEAYTWATQKLNNKVAAYEFDAKAHGRVDKNGEADFQKDPLPMLDEWVVLDHGSDKYGISERGLMTRPIPKFFTQPTKPPSPDELADSYRKATKPLDYLRLKRGGTVDELVASFKVMKRGLGTTQAAKGGEAPDLTGMSNFLATDKVPDTIFGIPIVSRREDYTEEDIAFFQEHPEAGGYYDMGEGTPEDGTVEGAPVQADAAGDSMDLRSLWSRAVRSTGDLDGMARVFAAMSGESSLNQRGATAEQISNGHLARLVVHANETARYNSNPANRDRRSVMDTTNNTSHVLSGYEWGTGPGANWFDAEKMEPRFDLINRSPIATKTARALIMNGARFLNGELSGKGWLPSDAISYGDGPNGLMPDREDIKPTENHLGPMPRGFRIGRKKGAK